MSTGWRRGFKSESERTALAVRAELDLSARDRLDPRDLAREFGIPVVSLTELLMDGADRRHVAHLGSALARFSAATMCVRTQRLIVYNPRHPSGRRANSLAHELSHVILEHTPTPVLGPGGCRYWNRDLEDEADWQAGALLVPRDGAFYWLRHGTDPFDAARHFGVSDALFRWRMNQTGLSRQLRAMGA